MINIFVKGIINVQWDSFLLKIISMIYDIQVYFYLHVKSF